MKVEAQSVSTWSLSMSGWVLPNHQPPSSLSYWNPVSCSVHISHFLDVLVMVSCWSDGLLQMSLPLPGYHHSLLTQPYLADKFLLSLEVSAYMSLLLGGPLRVGWFHWKKSASWWLPKHILFFFLSLFILREREAKRERIPRRFRTVSAEPDVGSNPCTMRS